MAFFVFSYYTLWALVTVSTECVGRIVRHSHTVATFSFGLANPGLLSSAWMGRASTCYSTDGGTLVHYALYCECATEAGNC